MFFTCDQIAFFDNAHNDAYHVIIHLDIKTWNSKNSKYLDVGYDNILQCVLVIND